MDINKRFTGKVRCRALCAQPIWKIQRQLSYKKGTFSFKKLTYDGEKRSCLHSHIRISRQLHRFEWNLQEGTQAYLELGAWDMPHFLYGSFLFIREVFLARGKILLQNAFAESSSTCLCDVTLLSRQRSKDWGEDIIAHCGVFAPIPVGKTRKCF